MVELLVALSEASKVNIEGVDLGLCPLSDQVRLFEGNHTANPGAVLVGVLVAAPHAMDHGHTVRRRAVGELDLAARRPGGVEHSLYF